MRNFTQTLSVGALLAVTACGAASDLTAAGTTQQKLTADSGAAVLQAYRLIEGDFSTNGNSPECLALRTKMFAKRQEVKLGSEWQALAQTNEFKTITDHENQFNDAGCKPDGSNTAEACTNLQAQLENDATALGATSQWASLDNNSNWQDLQTDYSKAQSIGCL